MAVVLGQESAIHTNKSLSDFQRFIYLKSLLKYEAPQTVSDFAIKNVDYCKAVALLHERYGQKHRIVQTYLNALLDLPAPMNTISSLRTFYDKTEGYIRGLETLDQMESSNGALLVPVILKKIPEEIRKNIAREHGSSNWSLSGLQKMPTQRIECYGSRELNQQQCRKFTDNSDLLDQN